MEYWGVIVLLVGCWLGQVFMVMKQNKDYQASLNDVKKLPVGHIGVGIAKAKFNFGSGIIMIVATDLDGRIIDLREMKGFTVFSRFKIKKLAIGKSAPEFNQVLKRKKEVNAFQQAVALINTERTKQKLQAITF